MILLSLFSVTKPPRFRIAMNADWRTAVRYILERQQSGDGAIFYIPNTYPYIYYSHRAETQHWATLAPDVLYPPDPWQPMTRGEIANVTDGRQRVWLVLHNESSHHRELALIQSTLSEIGFRPLEKSVFSGDPSIVIALYSRGQQTAVAAR
jgi:hypothetical protein